MTAIKPITDITLDPWQVEVAEAIKQKKNVCVRSGRQAGKTEVVSRAAGNFALENQGKTILVIASVERQAELLFARVLDYIYRKNSKMIKKGKDKPTKHKLQLVNGSVVYCLPAGESGYGIRGFTIDLLIVDEAAFVNKAVFTAITPMLAVTGGNLVLLSTPHGREGYFADAFKDPAFLKFHISSLDCLRISKEFLEHERATMSKREFMQEYMGEFCDDLMQLFPDFLITRCQLLKRRDFNPPDRNYYLGVDVARMGGDESTFEILEREPNRKLRQVESVVKIKILTTETTEEILNLDKVYHFKKIYIDDGGIGAAIFDNLLKVDDVKRRVVGINNAKRVVEYKFEKAPKKILQKEVLYANLLSLMEHGEILLLDDPEIFQSLKSIQFEYIKGEMRIFGSHDGEWSHVCEGLIRAAWCVKDKSLNIWLR